jgi:hypothetical protein
MSIDKGLYELPQGLEAINEAEPVFEIEIEDPESVNINMGGLEIEIDKEEDDFSANLAEEMSEKTLDSIVGDLIGDVDSDISARKDWI